jgi:hypothetical protein
MAPVQEEVYQRVLQSRDYRLLAAADEPCWCGSGQPTKKCHPLDPGGVLCGFKHPDGETCKFCPFCIALPAVLELQKIANHLELVKTDDRHIKDSERLKKQRAFAQVAFGPQAETLSRKYDFLSQSSEFDCGKMKAHLSPASLPSPALTPPALPRRK